MLFKNRDFVKGASLEVQNYESKRLEVFPFSSPKAKIALLLGGGELGKEVALELSRYSIKVVVADRYEFPPASQIASESFVIDMTDSNQLRELIEKVQPDFIIPEIEAIATEELIEIEKFGLRSSKKVQVVPSAKAVNLTMNREGIRRLAAETLGLPTSEYEFASSFEELELAANRIGFPVVIKPIQSSSGKGQSVAKTADDLKLSWEIAQTGARGKAANETVRVIVEGFVDFDYEITLLTVLAVNGITFLDPIGHIQIDGDYRTSWQGARITDQGLESAKSIAEKVTKALVDEVETGWGIFGVELFVKKTIYGEEVIFSEVSPRPHDTGLVTLISQDSSEFKLHAKAILGFPVYQPKRLGVSASYAVLAKGDGVLKVSNLDSALVQNKDFDFDLRVFGKPEVKGERRVAVVLARGNEKTELEDVIDEVSKAAEKLEVLVVN